MMPTLTDETVLVRTPHCVVREQEDRYVVYNSRTDELHLIPPLGHYLYRLCDGVHDVGAICRAFAAGASDGGAEARQRIVAYLEALVTRGVLQGDSHA
jgi:hypothetical protein